MPRVGVGQGLYGEKLAERQKRKGERHNKKKQLKGKYRE